MGINVGIDLGTTYSAVAVFDNATGQVRILKNSDEKTYTPSVTYIENGKVKIGDEAKQLQASGDLNAAAFYKSMMGERGYTLYLDGKEYSPEELSGLFLRELIHDISQHNSVQISGAVITCPAYFNEAQRLATLNAGKAAGLKVLKVINEPTAAIIAYGLTGSGKKNVMVYDLGGGTFDVTIAEVDGSSVRVLTTNGNHQLGGKNWDAVISDELKQRFFDEFNINIEDTPEDFYQLKVQCEDIKKRLTNMGATTAIVQSQGYTGRYEITREFFDLATHSLLNETSLLIERCFAEIGGGFSWENLDEVVLVGGSTRMPQVKEFLQREYGRDPVTKNIDVDTIVAAGAAMQAQLSAEKKLILSGATLGKSAATLDGGIPKRLVLTGDSIQDITSHSLGMLALSSDGKTFVNSVIIKKNSPLNKAFSKDYIFLGEKMDVFVLQGEFSDPHDCTLLYKYCITGFSKGKKTEFTLFFTYNQDGVVEVQADARDGRQLYVEKTTTDENIDGVISRLCFEMEEQKRRSSRAEIMFMVDTSYSMNGDPITKARDAINDFIRHLDLSRFSVSILNFADSGRFECRNENNIHSIERAVSSLAVETCGIGNDETPLGTFGNQFTEKNNRIIVVLTDGMWANQGAEESAASRLRANGITIYAIGFGGADENFLGKVASEKGARKIDLSKLSQTFVEIAGSIATEK